MSTFLVETGLTGAIGTGIVFVEAGLAKLRHRDLVAGVVANYRLLPEALVAPVAMLLPVVTAWSAPAALHRYADCARAMDLAPADEGDQAAVARLIDALHRINHDLAVPTPKSYGIDPARWTELLPLMAEQALASGSPANNPRVPDAQTIQALYCEAWG